MCEGWHKAGHSVKLYNNPLVPDGSPFIQLPISDFNPQDERDFLIIFRSPNSKSYGAKGKKIWWSTDQSTVGDFAAFSKTVEKIVTISKFHSDYFKMMYNISNCISIDLPVRTWEYSKVEKVEKRCIFTSVPDRGVMQLYRAWPYIVEKVPEASLVITSDHRLWNKDFTEDVVRNFRLSYATQKNVEYLAAVKRSRLVEEQCKAQLHLYPCKYDELFCISVAESQVAGVFPITSTYGALNSTNMGMTISGNPTDERWIDIFVENAVKLLRDEKLPEKLEHLRTLANKRFSITRIMEQWDERVFA
jgi:glycosyltransferase involved in cell wall biosynthesis